MTELDQKRTFKIIWFILFFRWGNWGLDMSTYIVCGWSPRMMVLDSRREYRLPVHLILQLSIKALRSSVACRCQQFLHMKCDLKQSLYLATFLCRSSYTSEKLSYIWGLNQQFLQDVLLFFAMVGQKLTSLNLLAYHLYYLPAFREHVL